jgi:hypothetical protein
MLDRLALALAGRGVRPVEILARVAVPKGDPGNMPPRLELEDKALGARGFRNCGISGGDAARIPAHLG